MTRFLLPSLLALPILAAPMPAQAALVTCGGSAQSPCTLCDLVKGVATITDYIRDIMVFAALAIIVAMGILYIVSAGNPGMMETAKKGVFAALAGLVIILAAWIIVNTVMFVVFDAKSDLGIGASFSVSGGFEFDCGASVSAVSSTASGGSAGGSPSTASIPGPCTIAASPAAPTTGGGVTLTASCQGGTPTTYAWTGSCAANGNKCVENGLTLGSHAYSVVASNAAGSATASKTVTAGTAASTTYALSISKAGSGTVTGTGISCGGDCSESYASGTNVALTASPAAGNVFASWGGACTGNAPTCAVAMTEVWTVFANFIPIPPPGTYLLAVSKDGSGTGTVTGTGISCGADCSQTYTGNPTVTLTATTGPNSVFEGWFGACSGTGTCSIPMTSAKSVAASFTSTVVAGGGSGGSGGGGGGNGNPLKPPAGGCSMPAGTTVYTNANPSPNSGGFDNLFDGASTASLDDMIPTTGQTKAYEFSNNLAFKNGDIYNFYSTNLKDMSISACPGDFDVPAECKATGMGPKVYWSNDGAPYVHPHMFNGMALFPDSPTCNIGAGGKVYLNIRALAPVSYQIRNEVLNK